MLENVTYQLLYNLWNILWNIGLELYRETGHSNNEKCVNIKRKFINKFKNKF